MGAAKAWGQNTLRHWGRQRCSKGKRRYFLKACDGGNRPGCALLGVNYRKGIGVAKDAAKANEYFLKACKDIVIGGLAAACTAVGFNYQKGIGVAKDAAKANEYYLKACDGEDMVACLYLEFQLRIWQRRRKGLRPRERLVQASLQWREHEGCNNLGVNYDKGKGVAKDLGRAKDYYREKACDGGAMQGLQQFGFQLRIWQRRRRT